LAVKDHYTFDFLGLTEEYSEYELEQALVKNIRSFLSEMGGAFAFVGNQYRVEVGGQEYFIDLLLFHRRLRCLVAIELKVGDFKPEHKGKMEFYLEALDRQERMEGENPPIGMIICRYKNKTVVEYALRTASRPIGVATYTIVPQLPEDYRDELPSPGDRRTVAPVDWVRGVDQALILQARSACKISVLFPFSICRAPSGDVTKLSK
jgi:hypothetical protein